MRTVTLNWIIVNKRCWFFSVARKKDIHRYMRDLNDVFDHGHEDLTINFEVGKIQHKKAKGFRFSSKPWICSDDELLLYNQYLNGDEINIFLFDKVRSWGLGRSKAVPVYNAIALKACDLVFGKEHSYVLAHEIGHMLFGLKHVRGCAKNLMHENLRMIDGSISYRQLMRAFDSRYARSK